MKEPFRCPRCGLECSPLVYPCPHCKGTGDLDPFDHPENEIDTLRRCITRHEQASDEHMRELLDLIGDKELAADNPSWRRVLDAVIAKAAILSEDSRHLSTLLAAIHCDAEYVDRVGVEQAAREAVEQIGRERKAYKELRGKP